MVSDAVTKENRTVAPRSEPTVEGEANSDTAAALSRLAQAKLSEAALLSHTTHPAVLRDPPGYLSMTDPFAPANANEPVKPKIGVPEKSESSFYRAYEWAGNAADVVEQGAIGTAASAYNSVVAHPGRALLTLGEGAAIGVAIAAAAPVAAALGAGTLVVAGVGLAAEATMVGLTAVGALTAAEGVYGSVSSSSPSIGVLMNKSAHTADEIEAARKDCQSKLGEAGVDAAQGAVMALGGAAVGFKIASRFGSLAKSGEGAIAAVAPDSTLTPATIASDVSSPPTGATSVVRPEVALAHSADVKTGSPVAAALDTARGGKADVVTRNTPLPNVSFDNAEEASRPAGIGVKSQELGTEGGLKSRSLPPGSVEHFSNRLDEFLKSSNKLDVKKTEQKIEDLQSKAGDLRSDLMFSLIRATNKSGKETVSLYSNDLADVDAARAKVKNYPEAAKILEEYFVNREMHQTLKVALDLALESRRAGVAAIMNDEAKKLFPGGIVPELSVLQLPADSDAAATYANGIVRIPDSSFHTRDKLRDLIQGNDLPGRLVHEMKHGEQDGLMVRQYIDSVTNGDRSGRALSADEKVAVIQKYATSTGRILPEKLVDDINLKREGKVLTPEEVTRAQLIEKGRRSALRDGGVTRLETARFKELKSERDAINQSPDIAIDLLSDEKKLNYLFKGDIPDEVLTIHQKLSLMEKNGEELPYDDIAFVVEASDTLSDALGVAEHDAGVNIEAGLSDYRGWEHEQESHSVAKQTDERLNVPQEADFEKLLRNIFSPAPEEMSPDNLKNTANLELFEKLEAARAQLTGAENFAFEHVVATVQDEAEPLTNAGANRAFIDKFAEEEEEGSDPLAQRAYLQALYIVREHVQK